MMLNIIRVKEARFKCDSAMESFSSKGWTLVMWIIMMVLCVRMAARVALGSCVPAYGCNKALAYYTFNVSTDENLSAIATRFQANESSILWYSRLNASSMTSIVAGQPLFIPFSCGCANNTLGHDFPYKSVAPDDVDVGTIASNKFEFLTTVSAINSANDDQDLLNLATGQTLKVPVRCFCGDPSVSSLYGLFLTYAARDNDNAASIAEKFNTTTELLQSFNPDRDLNLLQDHVDVVFVPAADGNGVYIPFNNIGHESSKNNFKVVVTVSVGAAILVLSIATGTSLFYVYVRRTRRQRADLDQEKDQCSQSWHHVKNSNDRRKGSLSERSLKFSYKDLATATDNFNVSKKIGQGGYGSVFYGEIQGQKVAIKMMNMQATKEFFAELKVLTRVHHKNLVHLIGYCMTESLFLIYEYMDNGTLSDHLKHSESQGNTPLPWKVRVKIALDAARGLEYIHEHTTPTYIHRDIKSSNILLNQEFHAKVSDFGMAKLLESWNASNVFPSKLVGTFGYMAPEYARFGDISEKADVFSFGIVLFEIISAKGAIIHGVYRTSSTSSSVETSQGLAALFQEVLADDIKGKEKLKDLVDEALGDDYPLESAWKLAQLAGACTRPQASLRPNMSAVVIALMTILSSPHDLEAEHIMWDAINHPECPSIGSGKPYAQQA